MSEEYYTLKIAGVERQLKRFAVSIYSVVISEVYQCSRGAIL